MAKIPRNVIDEIRNSVDIGDVIGRYVQLHQAGKNLIGLCPFHDEKTPSFSVNEEKQFWMSPERKCISIFDGVKAYRFCRCS